MHGACHLGMNKNKDRDMAFLKKRLLAIAALGMGTALAGCTGMGDYGYGGVGYASDYYGGGYGGAGYGTGYYGSGLGTGYYGGGLGGWYNDFYYPGTGVYVFDRGGRRSQWNDGQRRYWQNRGQQGRPGYGRPNGVNPPRWNGGRPGVRPDGQHGRPGQGWNGGRPDGQPGRPGVGRPDGQRPGFGRPDGQQRPSFGRPDGQRPSFGRPGGGRGEGGGFGNRGGGPRGGGRTAGTSAPQPR